MREQLQRFTPEERAQASGAVCRRLAGEELWQRAHTVLAYAPRRDELDIWPLLNEALEEGKTVALPQYDPATGAYRACRLTSPIRGLALGKFGIQEPGLECAVIPLKQLDLILVPGVAFDLAGHRLGRGGGYYDQLLARVRGRKWGLGYDEQVQPEIPVETHDVLLDCIWTPTRRLMCGAQRLGDDLVG
jgi:5-formyltetrahydrofolate cyclo-ligase